VGDYPYNNVEHVMKTIQMTIDEDLLERVDQAILSLGIARSAFIRQALERSLRDLVVAEMEQKQIAGYQQHPVSKAEFNIWEAEQVWVEI
jgi:metal-responsive CopG/Arc/MetJ family transcriptional regulator